VSTDAIADVEVAVIGAGVVGCAVALVLARRGAAVSLLEAEKEPALGASGANSGVLHTGFDSIPGELETELMLASNAAREEALQTLEIPVLRCGAVISPQDDVQRHAVRALAARASRNGVTAFEHHDGTLEIPGESVTDPVAYTFALGAEAKRQGAEFVERFRLVAVRQADSALTLRAEDGRVLRCRAAVNCAGLEADMVARLFGDDSFSIYPRKGEFLVFEPPDGQRLKRIVLPVPSERTKGVLVFPTLDGKIVTGPTAVDLDDKRDWSVRPEARAEIMPKALALYPELEGAEPIAAYAGLRPAGRGVNYVIGRSGACEALVNVAAIRSTGLSASLGIAEHVGHIVCGLGVAAGPERALRGGGQPAPVEEWWRRAARHAAVA
jgi:glycerol-3-phosphate dehydrogenase